MKYFCSKDCLDSCEFDIEIKNGKPVFTPIAKPWDITPFVCPKLKDFYYREVFSKDKSFIDENGEKKPVSNSEAVKEFAGLLKKSKNILYNRGTGSLGYSMLFWDVLMGSLDAEISTVEGGLCDESGIEAHMDDFGVLINPPVENLYNADKILIFGKNAKITSPHFYSIMKDLHKKGKKLIYLDPIYTETARIADKFIRINPGADGLLCAAVLTEMGEEDFDVKELISKCGLSMNEYKFFKSCIEEGKTGFVTGFGLHRYVNGKNSRRWINRLAVKSGNEELLYYSRSSKSFLNTPEVKGQKGVTMYDAVENLKNGEYDLVVNIASNPLGSFADINKWSDALDEAELIVVDTNITPTAEKADVFIRVGGMFAQEDVQGSFFFSGSQTRGRLHDNMLSDFDLVKALGTEMNIEIPEFDYENVPRKEEGERLYIVKDLELLMPAGGQKGKYRLISGSSKYWINSQVFESAMNKDDKLYISEKTASEMSLIGGEIIRVTGDAGYFDAVCEISDMVDNETVMTYKNRPMHFGYPNMAVSDAPDDSATGMAIYDNFVNISRI